MSGTSEAYGRDAPPTPRSNGQAGIKEVQNCGISHFRAKFECLSFVGECLSFVGLGSNGQAGINGVQNRGISHFCAKFECLSFVGHWLGRSLAAWPEVVDRLEFGRRRTAGPRLFVGNFECLSFVGGQMIRGFLGLRHLTALTLAPISCRIGDSAVEPQKDTIFNVNPYQGP
jgi:hypothetical protein